MVMADGGGNGGCGSVVGYAVGAILLMGGFFTLFGEPGVGLLVMAAGGVVLWLTRRGPGASQRVEPSEPSESEVQPPSPRATVTVTTVRDRKPRRPTHTRKQKAPDHEPPPAPLPGQTIQPWGRCHFYTDVEGEFARPNSIRALLRSTPGFNKPEGAQRQDLTAALVADPTNPHDSQAVAVYLEGHHVGYLSRQDARRYGPAIRRAAAVGDSFAVPGRIWGTKNTYTSADVVGQVNIHLPDPALMLPETELPEEGYIVLPGRHTIQVTKEEEHHDVLIRHVRPDPGKPVAVELVVIEEKRPRSSVTLVQVELDGERVGILTPTMTKQLQPIIEHLEQMQLRTFARAVVFGSSLKAEVTLNTIKATDGDVDEWLHKVDLEHDSANQLNIQDDDDRG